MPSALFVMRLHAFVSDCYLFTIFNLQSKRFFSKFCQQECLKINNDGHFSGPFAEKLYFCISIIEDIFKINRATVWQVA
jgi:hypothetical protein